MTRHALGAGNSALVVAIILASGAVRKVPGPHAASGTAGRPCADCHRSRVMATHGPEFVRETHGAPAIADRAQCLGCHEAKQCLDCHLQEPPPWHSEAVRHPGRGAPERQEHARTGIERHDGCLECHDGRFPRQCGTCHLREEWAP